MKTCIRHLSRSIVIYGAMLLATNLHEVLVKEDNKGCNNLSRKSFSSSRKRAANRHNRAKRSFLTLSAAGLPIPLPPFPLSPSTPPHTLLFYSVSGSASEFVHRDRDGCNYTVLPMARLSSFSSCPRHCLLRLPEGGPRLIRSDLSGRHAVSCGLSCHCHLQALGFQSV